MRINLMDYADDFRPSLPLMIVNCIFFCSIEPSTLFPTFFMIKPSDQPDERFKDPKGLRSHDRVPPQNLPDIPMFMIPLKPIPNSAYPAISLPILNPKKLA